MIKISLKFLGSETVATCTIPKENGREETFCVRDKTGAKSLNGLIDKLSQFHSGEAFSVSGVQDFNGTVPHKRPSARRKRQVIFV